MRAGVQRRRAEMHERLDGFLITTPALKIGKRLRARLLGRVRTPAQPRDEPEPGSGAVKRLWIDFLEVLPIEWLL